MLGKKEVKELGKKEVMVVDCVEETKVLKKKKTSPSEQPCQPSENPVHPSFFYSD